MPGDVHAVMQDADDGDPIVGRPQIHDVTADSPSTVAGDDIPAILGTGRRFGQPRAGCFDQIKIGKRLRSTPMCSGIVEDFVQIALRTGRKAILSHGLPLYAA
jgi:hypothetical protein